MISKLGQKSAFFSSQLRFRVAWWVQEMLAVGPFSVSTTTHVKSKGCTISVSLCCTTPGVTTLRWGAGWSDLFSLICLYTPLPYPTVLNLVQQKLNTGLDQTHLAMFIFPLIPAAITVILKEQCSTSHTTTCEGIWNERGNSLSSLLE